MEKQWKQWQTLFYWAPKSLQMVNCSHEMKSCLLLGRKIMTNLDSILKSRDITLPTKVHLVKAMVFPVVMYGCEELYYKESWAPKNWCFWSVGLEKTLESPLDCRRIHPVDPKVVSSVLNVHWKDWYWSWNCNTLATWSKNWLNWKDPDAGQDWRQEEKWKDRGWDG